jgi:pyruvate/2-oxoglutarate/acetoin dehydrogenase E1 component
MIDPRTLQPLDLDTIVVSVRRINRLGVVREGWKFGHWRCVGDLS